MKYLAIPQPTANWLLARTAILHSLHEELARWKDSPALRDAELVEGPFRVAASADGRVIGAWNADYLSGTGEEAWGFIRLGSPLGLFDVPDFSREVFERCLYVINQRLQALIIEGALIHRSWPDGVHTCLAARGTEARQLNLAYLEADVLSGTSRTRSVICVGPEHDFEKLCAAAKYEGKNLPALVSTAGDLIAPLRKRPHLDARLFRSLRAAIASIGESTTAPDLANVTLPTGTVPPPSRDARRSLGWSYQDWVADTSTLSPAQRRILQADAPVSHPVRIVGPAGSGKTLLMQLLAMRRLLVGKENKQDVRVLYIVHNSAMARNVRGRFEVLGAGEFLNGRAQSLGIETLAEYSRRQLEMQTTAVIDPDAQETKLFQLEQVSEALRTVLEEEAGRVRESPLLSQVARDTDLFGVFARLVMAEISTAIKGHGLVNDERRYVASERRLSRLHGLLGSLERQFVYAVFRRYHNIVFEQLEVLDSDDIALSLLGRLRTPIWELKRKTLGFDFVFVDETQLFNENERRIFPLLTKGTTRHVPIVLALDEAQEVFGLTSAGLGSLGIEAIANESLPFNHRSTREIVALAFFIIQRTTDLFGSEFPDFTGVTSVIDSGGHPLAAPPMIEIGNGREGSFGRFVVARISDLRRANLRQIGVICHAESHWDGLLAELKQSNLPLKVVEQRGDTIASDKPVVVLTRPAHVGGQEFDAVVVVGLEQGLVPPRIQNNDALASAVEQQALREMYLSFTRARYQLKVLLSSGASPTAILQEAVKAGLLNVVPSHHNQSA